MSLFYLLAKDGNGFESLVGRLLTQEYPGTGKAPRFVASSSQRQGDFGIDGFLTDGVVFQVFFPLQPGLGKVDFSSAVMSKVRDTLKKLELNKVSIQQAIGNVVSKLVLVIPEDLSPELTGQVTEKAESQGLPLEVFGESKLLNLFSKHFNAVRDCMPQFKGDQSPDSLNTAAGQLWDKGANEDARSLYCQAYVVALAWNDNKAASHALAGLGWCAFIARDLPAALAFARAGGEIASRCGDSHYIASAALIEAKVAFAQSEWNEAEKLALSALDHGIRGKSAVRWDAQFTLAEIALYKGDLTGAQRRLNLAWRHDIKAGGRRAIGAYDLKAHILDRQGKTGLALRYLEKAALVARNLGNLVLHAKYLVQSLHVLAGQNRNREVLGLCKRCEQAARASGESRLELEVLMAKAWALSELGQASRSKAVLERVVAVAESGSCFDVAARACLILAQKLRESQKWEEAKTAAERGASLAKNSGNPYLYAFASIEQCEQCSLKGAFPDAAERLQEAEGVFAQSEVPPSFSAVISKLRVRILDGQGHTDKAIQQLDVFTAAAAANDELKVSVDWAEKKREELTGKLRWFQTTRRLLNEKKPLVWAGTQGAKSLQEAHQWVLGLLMDWWDGTMGGTPCPTGVYDMWGEANYGRMLLNHRAFAQKQGSFHLCVEVSSVREARLACRMLSPICDCLTLLWKGPFKPVILPVPAPLVFENPIRHWKPRPPEYWNEGARVYHMMLPPLGRFDLPYPIVNFYMKEARDLAASGRLVLVPAPMVGCFGSGHKDTERMFCDVAAADVVIRTPSGRTDRHPLEMVVPWFPSIPLRDLARLCDDHGECLEELRQKCLDWSLAVQNDKQLLFAKIKSEIRLLSRDIERAFKRVSRVARSGSQLDMRCIDAIGGQASREKVRTSVVRCEANNRMAAFIEGDVGAHPWFPYWSFEQRGLRWTLGGPLHSSRSGGEVTREAIINGNVFHWLKAPGEFTTSVLAVRKDIAPGEAKFPGDFKLFEVKGGKMTEVPLPRNGNPPASAAKGTKPKYPQSKAAHADNNTSQGKSQQGHATHVRQRRR